MHAAGLGLVNAGVGDSEWAKIPKKPGAKGAKKKAGAPGQPVVGTASKFDAAALLGDE